MARISGNSNKNILNGFDTDDEIYGYGDDDVLSGYGGADELEGHDGDDSLYGGSENDELSGGIGNDWLYGGSHDDTLWGDDGDDVLKGESGADRMYGGRHNDTYYVENSGDVVMEYAGEGHDTVYTHYLDYTLTANVEDLVIQNGTFDGTGNDLHNTITGSNTNNTLKGMNGNDTLYGGGGFDTLDGGGGSDTMYGGTQSDTYKVDNVFDAVVEYAGEGIDTVQAYIYTYSLGANVENLELLAGGDGFGNGLDNRITGNSQDNTLKGHAGADTLLGGFGNDILHGGSGADTLWGETGADQFIFDTALGKGNVDTIADFNVADDTIGLDNAVFTRLPAADLAMLSAAEFRVGSGAMDTTDRIIYNSTTGALLYDSDGIGAGQAVQFASMQAGLALTNLDFYIL